MRSATALALAVLLASPAGAVFVKSEMDALDTEPLFDSEYFLDLLSFRDPLEWRWAWEAAPLGYRFDGASLDRSDLFLEQEVKLPKKLNDWFAFAYQVEHRGDKDLQELHQWIALDFGPWSGFTAGLIGEPSFDKQDADVGLRASQVWGPWTARASTLFVDFPFNERGKTGESYPVKPVTHSFSLRREVPRGSVRAWTDFDMPTVRLVTATNRVYGYRRTRAGLVWDRPSTADAWGWRAAWTYEYKKETNRLQPATIENFGVHRKVHDFDAALEGRLTDRDRLEAGGRFFVRGGLTDRQLPGTPDARHKRWELQPYGRWRRTVKPWAVQETALYLSGGEDYRIFPGVGPDKRDSIQEAKLGYGWDLFPAPSGRIGIFGTFDLDDAGRHIWDGGNIRAMFFF